jgi:hypothetical protein
MTFQSTDKHRCIQLCKTYTAKQHVFLTSRCNTAIQLALKACKDLGKKTVFIPDSGGWMYYEKFIQNQGLAVSFIPTTDGYFDSQILSKCQMTNTSVLLAHSLAGYFRELPTDDLANFCSKNEVVYIEDICGTIASKPCVGDILVCSFGKAKPVDFGSGGCIATSDSYFAQFFQTHLSSYEISSSTNFSQLFEQLQHISSRYIFLTDVVRRTVQLLHSRGFECIFDERALVIIIPYANDTIKEAIIALLDAQKIEHTLCPRYIRSNTQAVCAEIKRLSGWSIDNR